MTRLQRFLQENKWGGAEGLDLYNHTYFTQVHPAITTRTINSNNYFIMEQKQTTEPLEYRVRKLTPKECFRLMGVTDSDADKMIGVLSKSRCYQVAGNSIVVDVLAAIFSQLFIENKNKHQQMELF
jgi:site-specific DNA-cytosine methylase